MGKSRHFKQMCGKEQSQFKSDNLKVPNLPASTQDAIGNLFRAIKRLDGKANQ